MSLERQEECTGVIPFHFKVDTFGQAGEAVRSWGATAVLGSPQVEQVAWFPPGATGVEQGKQRRQGE
ncbi:hypothetical protein [Halotia branconii]|uniref:Uncharacterized protein n=1 Tax=Halotia branconii CENA392 TaxID=1539056 RepID=A0AAJ6NNR0_9CYAN|nr:hypothetical protein [Halotia branconii]WGV23908.1 hypothetical protein QI031_19120 [Halotia branconii CENA392]